MKVSKTYIFYVFILLENEMFVDIIGFDILLFTFHLKLDLYFLVVIWGL
jgi:hypothetical protein